MLGVRKRKRVESEGEGNSTDEEPTAKRGSPGWLGQTFSTLTSKVKGAFRVMKVWFTGEEEEREGAATQRGNSLPGDLQHVVSGSEGSTSFDEDSVLHVGDSDVPSPPLVSLMTSRHSSDRGVKDSAHSKVCQSWTGRTPLLDQMERQRDRSQYFCLLQKWAATHTPSIRENTAPWGGSGQGGTRRRKLAPSTPSTHPRVAATSPPATSPALLLWSSGSVHPPPRTAAAPFLERTEEDEDIVLRNPVKSKPAERPYRTCPSPPRPEFERLQAKLKDLRLEVLEHRTDFAAQSDAYEKYAALARKQREELVDTLASKLYRVGLGKEDEDEEEEEEEGELGVSLTQKQQQKVDEVWHRSGSSDQVMSSLPRLTVRRCDLLTLKGLEWLNDEVINFYMTLISDRSQQKGAPRRAYGMSTFFYPKLLSSGYSGVRRWTKKVDVFSFDVVLVPVHLGIHWTLAVIDLREKIVTYFDSMRGDNHACHFALREWLVAEAKDKKGMVLDLAGWKSATPKDIPRQQNSSDCGVFTCMFARYYTNSKSFTFKQADMQDIRRRMVCEILDRRLF